MRCDGQEGLSAPDGDQKALTDSLKQKHISARCGCGIQMLRLHRLTLLPQVLVEQGKHPVVQPVILTRPASPSHPEHGQEDGEEDEEDWQQLSALPSSSASGYLDKERATGVEPAMYVDRGVEGGEPMSFRELFLSSNALESIVAGTLALLNLPCTPSRGAHHARREPCSGF